MFWIPGLLLISALLLVNRLSIKQWFQLNRLKSIECPGFRADCRDFFWLHRVNSLSKYQQLESSFGGFESDITYIDSLRKFFVFHPGPDEKPFELSWESFLASVNTTGKKWYLDVRGVDRENVFQAIADFEKDIPDTTLLKRQAILEFYDCDAAYHFQKAGYTVAINYGTLRSLLNVENVLPDSVLQKINGITRICSDAELLEEMKKFFPGRKYLVWELSYKNYLNMKKLVKYINDRDVELVLVSVSS